MRHLWLWGLGIGLGCGGAEPTRADIDWASCILGDGTDTIDNPGQCSREWICGDRYLYVGCDEADGEGWDCTCQGDIDTSHDFSMPAGACLTQIGEQDLNTICGWSLP